MNWRELIRSQAQLDRFLFKLDVPGVSPAVLERIVNGREMGAEPVVKPVMSREELVSLSALVRRIYLPPVVANYIARLVGATHPGCSKAASGVKFGASPRAALGLAAGARARALLEGRVNASFEDVAALAGPVLSHRVILDYSARLNGGTSTAVVACLLEEIPRQDHEIPTVLAES